jgi:C-terminal processing protease CtpA/Prc
LLDERILAGPTHEGRLVPVMIEQHRLEPVPARLRLRCPVVVLADHRTRGRAELELVAFDRLGVTIVGSTSAGDRSRTTHFHLPGGLQVRFGQTDMLRHDGTRLSGSGVAPTLAVEPGWPALRERDELLERALGLLDQI